ncbi:MAG: YceI family protein, partial [Pseudoxanthomonas sp.]
FEADRYPVVVFVSKPYDEQLLAHGGDLAGELSIRGITRPKTLTVAPSTCARPAQDCDVVASGAVRRSDYDMDDWMMAVSDRVVFVLRARLKAAAP